MQLYFAPHKGQVTLLTCRLFINVLKIIKSELQWKNDLPNASKNLIITLYLYGFPKNHICCEREETMLAGVVFFSFIFCQQHDVIRQIRINQEKYRVVKPNAVK